MVNDRSASYPDSCVRLRVSASAAAGTTAKECAHVCNARLDQCSTTLGGDFEMESEESIIDLIPAAVCDALTARELAYSLPR